MLGRTASDGLSVLDERIEMLVHKSMNIEAYLELEENKDSHEAKKFYHIKNKLELVMRDALKSDDFIFDIENVRKIQKNHIKTFLFVCIKTAIAAFNKNIVIFDTPENKFSVSWQRVFVKRMRKINIQSQFIFITHSSHIASSDGMKNIVRI